MKRRRRGHDTRRIDKTKDRQKPGIILKCLPLAPLNISRISCAHRTPANSMTRRMCCHHQYYRQHGVVINVIVLAVVTSPQYITFYTR